MEGMAHLMRDHIHIGAGAVPVAEHKRAVAADLFHIAAHGLAGLGEHIEALILEHPVNEFAGFGAKLVIHLLAALQQFIAGAVGLGVAVSKENRQVIEFGIRHAGAGKTALLQFVHHGHNILLHLRAVVYDFGRPITNAPHAQVAQFAVIVVAQGLGLRIAIFHKFGIQIVKLGAVGIEPLAFGNIGGLAHGTVRTLLVYAKLGQGEVFAVKMHHKAGVELLVFADEAVFLLLQGEHALIAGAHGQVHFGEQDLAVLFGQSLAVGAFQNGAVQSKLCIAHGGVGFVKMLALGGVESIAGINGVANAGKACHKAVIGIQFYMLSKRSQKVGRAGCILHTLC